METFYSQDTKNCAKFRADDLVIVFMGPKRVRKSNIPRIRNQYDTRGNFFSKIIDSLTGQPDRRSASFMKQIQAIRVYGHPKYANRLVLVDTPGFDDTEKSDMEILQMISDWLKKTYKKSINLAGIVYLHKITGNHMATPPHGNLRMFSQLFGAQDMKKAIVVTTLWDTVKIWTGAQREHDPTRNYWNVMIEKGASVARFGNTQHAAWEIIDMIIQESTTRMGTPLLQEELADIKLRLNEMKAGIMLYSNFQESLFKQQKTIQLLTQRGKKSDAALLPDLVADHSCIEKEFPRAFGQAKRLHTPIGVAGY